MDTFKQNSNTKSEEEKRKDREKVEKIVKQKLHNLSGYAILICKVLFIFFAFSLLCISTWKFIATPYSSLLIGLELSLCLIIIFRLIRYYTWTKEEPDNLYKVEGENHRLKLLLQDLDMDIDKYEQSSMYYFSQVRIFKHLIILLAGISTIVLGLQLDKLAIPFLSFEVDYKIFSKNTALILGAIITALTSYTTYWNLEKYWFTNKTIVNELRKVREKTTMTCVKKKDEKEITDKEIEDLFNDYQNVKEKFLKYWEGALGDKGTQSGKQ